jgi:hypothetical protein
MTNPDSKGNVMFDRRAAWCLLGWRLRSPPDGHWRCLLEFGAAGQSEIRREILVLPFDGQETPEEAKPLMWDGRVNVNAAKLEARHDAQVKAALASGPCAFIILGGKPDLSESVRRSQVGGPSMSG